MIKNIYSGFLAIGFSMLSFISIGHAEENIYSQLKSWYEQGQNVTFAEVKGYYSGRCFNFNTPATPRNSMLGYVEAASPGPGFPNPPPLFFDAIHHLNSAADFYDTANPYHQIREYTTFVNEQLAAGRFSTVVEKPTLGMYYDIEPNNRFDSFREFKKFNGYIVRQNTNLIAQNLQMSETETKTFVPAGQVISYCYYFKKMIE